VDSFRPAAQFQPYQPPPNHKQPLKVSKAKKTAFLDSLKSEKGRKGPSAAYKLDSSNIQSKAVHRTQVIQNSGQLAGHTARAADYRSPAAGYNAPAVYSASSGSFVPTAADYSTSAVDNSAPTDYLSTSGDDFSAPQAGNDIPSGKYRIPQTNYGSPSADYGAPSSGYGTPSSTYEAPSADYGVATGPATDEGFNVLNLLLRQGYSIGHGVPSVRDKAYEKINRGQLFTCTIQASTFVN
jgi:hypothetical protein